MRAIPLTLAACVVLGCPGDSAIVHRGGEPAVVSFGREDPEMSAAIQNARASFASFVEQLPRLRRAGAYYSVKVPIPVGADTEHIWLSSPVVQEGQVRGDLGNEPLAGPHKLGDVVSAPVEDISDWMAVIEGELFGGYTVLIARSRMSEAEQAEFDRSVGFHVPPAARPF